MTLEAKSIPLLELPADGRNRLAALREWALNGPRLEGQEADVPMDAGVAILLATGSVAERVAPRVNATALHVQRCM